MSNFSMKPKVIAVLENFSSLTSLIFRIQATNALENWIDLIDSTD